MTKNTTKRALLLSVMALVLCFTMLLGTTFAWFTDSVTSGKNTIVAGNLDIELEYSKTMADGSWKTVQGATDLFDDEALWEPGHAEVVYLKISNLGSLALKYKLMMNIANEVTSTNVNGGTLKLSEHLKYAVVDVTAAFADRAAAVAAAEPTAAALANYSVEGEMLKDAAAKTVALVVYMPETVGNEANYKTGATVPSIELGVSVVATQLVKESDSFGNTYDEAADFPNVSTLETVTVGEAITLTTIDENGDEAMTMTIPAALADKLAAEGITNVALAHTDPKLESNGTSTSLVYDSIEIVDQNGNIVDLETINVDDTPVPLVLPAQTTIAAGTTVAVYHDDRLMDSSTVEADGTIPYEITHLCEVKVIVAASTVEELKAALATGGFIPVVADIAATETLTVATTATIELNGYTLSGTSTSASASNLIKVATGASLTLKDGTVTFEAGLPDTDWGATGSKPYPGYANNTINCSGKLVIDGATIVNTTAKGGASYAIDCYPGADLIVNDGVINGIDKIAIRMFVNSKTVPTSVTINGGTVKGYRAVWIQLPGSDETAVPPANLTVNGGNLISTDEEYNQVVYSYSYGNDFSGTTIALNGGNYFGDVALGGGGKNGVKYGEEKITVNADACNFYGEYGVYTYNDNSSFEGVESNAKGTPIADVADLTAAVAKGGEYMLVADIDMGANTVTVAAGVSVAIDLNGHKLTGNYKGDGHYAMFTIPYDAALTIDGEGEVSAKTEATADNRSLALFYNAGKLTLNDGVYNMDNVRNGHTWIISAIVDNRTNNKNCTTELEINGGDFTVSGDAINLFRNYPQQGGFATLTINDGVFHTNNGATTYIWNQEAGSNVGELYFNGGSFENGVVYEDYNGQSDVHIADGVTIQGYSGNN